MALPPIQPTGAMLLCADEFQWERLINALRTGDWARALAIPSSGRRIRLCMELFKQVPPEEWPLDLLAKAISGGDRWVLIAV